MYVEIIGLNIILPSCLVCEYCCLPHGLKGFLHPQMHQVQTSPFICFLKFMQVLFLSY